MPPSALIWSASSPSPKPSRRTWKGCSPAAGWTRMVKIRSGVSAATFSMSMPPAAEAMNRTCLDSRSTRQLRYSSRAMAVGSSISRVPIGSPSGPLWWVTSRLPSRRRASVSRPLGAVHQHHPAGLAPSARMDLGLDHPACPAQLGAGPCGRLGRRYGHTLGDRDVVLLEQVLGLVFVEVHGCSGMAPEDGPHGRVRPILVQFARGCQRSLHPGTAHRPIE